MDHKQEIRQKMETNESFKEKIRGHITGCDTVPTGLAGNIFIQLNIDLVRSPPAAKW
jgi:hypothetical protein